MDATTERLYRHKKTGQVVRCVGYHGAVLAGRFCTVYEVVWPDGTKEDIQAETFRKKFEREAADG